MHIIWAFTLLVSELSQVRLPAIALYPALFFLALLWSRRRGGKGALIVSGGAILLAQVLAWFNVGWAEFFLILLLTLLETVFLGSLLGHLLRGR